MLTATALDDDIYHEYTGGLNCKLKLNRAMLHHTRQDHQPTHIKPTHDGHERDIHPSLRQFIPVDCVRVGAALVG